MSKKEDNKRCEDNRKKYTIPSGASYQLRGKNAIYIASNNTLKHELSKFIGAYMLHKWGDIKFSSAILGLIRDIDFLIERDFVMWSKDPTSFITEAVPKCDKDRRVDLISLRDETWYEFECNHSIKKEDCVTIYV